MTTHNSTVCDIPSVPMDFRPEHVYGAPAVTRGAGISYRQLDHWMRMGVLTPSICDAKGYGSRRQYSGEDMEVLAVMGELARLGAKLTDLAESRDVIRQALRTGRRWIMVTPDATADCSDDQTVAVMLECSNSAGAWIIDSHAVINAVSRRMGFEEPKKDAKIAS